MAQLSLERAIANIEKIKKRLDELDQRVITAQQVRVYAGLSDISNRIGLVNAGEFRAGNNKEPGFGFSGVRMAYPAMSYAGGTWHIAGISNDTLQFGLDATTGKAYFGGGVDVIDAFGIHVYDAAGKPAFIALSAAETINGEGLGAGDVMIGDNTAGFPNLLFDQSDSQLEFRKGIGVWTIISADGFYLVPGASIQNRLKFGSPGAVVADMYGAGGGASVGNIVIESYSNDDEDDMGTISLYMHQTTDGLGLRSEFTLDGNGSARWLSWLPSASTLQEVMAIEGTFDGSLQTGFGNRIRLGTGTLNSYLGAIDTELVNTGQLLGSVVISAVPGATDTLVEMLRMGTKSGGVPEISFNDTGDDIDFRIEGANISDVIAVDAGNDLARIHSVKTTTGDPSGVEGLIYYNTTDNVIKMYADGGWRTLASW